MSFSRELVNETCRDNNNATVATTETNKEYSNMNHHNNDDSWRSGCGHHLFNSPDFDRFLGSDVPSTSNSSNPFLSKDTPFLSKDTTFLSKDVVLPSLDLSTVFNSREAFSDLLKSDDWGMKYPEAGPNPPSGPIPNEPQKFFPEATETQEELKSALTSRDWMPMASLGAHIDVTYNGDSMFGGSDSDSTASPLPVDLPPPKTDWDSDFFSQLQLFPSAPSDNSNNEEEHEDFEEDEEAADAALSFDPILVDPPRPAEEHTAPAPSKAINTTTNTNTAPKRKRKRKPRKKVLPDVKVYVEPADFDVLLGRGGKSNHHPGNKRYREEVKNLQAWYRDIDDKDEKTDLSQCLVDYVHSYNGRFLEKDSDGWYIVPNIVARRKASQALREDNDPQKRAAKRARHLEKKKANEADPQQKKGR